MVWIDVGAEFAGHRLEELIGQGGMGVVYRARDLELNRVVALKVIASEFAQDPEFRERFKRESQLAASIRHPNVISIYRAGADGDQLYITMDYVDGTDLHGVIAVRGRLDPRFAAEIVAQVAGGLDAAHTRGLIHRDVKPGNVLIENERGRQRAYLTDFGLTKRAHTGSALTKTGLIVGTTDYLAPEQIEGGPIDARVDVYALGCVLYEALTGSVPYPRENSAAKIWAHMSEEVPSVLDSAPGVPPEFDEVVRRAMAKDPNHRFLSADEMGKAVLAAAGGAPIPAPPNAAGEDRITPPPSPSPTPPPRREQPTPRPSEAGARRVKRKRRRTPGDVGTGAIGEAGTAGAGAAGAAGTAAEADTEAGAESGAAAAAAPRAGEAAAPAASPGTAGAGRSTAGAGPGTARVGETEVAREAAAEAAGPTKPAAEPPTAKRPPAPPPSGRARPPVARRRALLGAGVAAVAVVVLAVVLLAGGGGDGDSGQSSSGVQVAAARPLPAGLAWQEARKAPFARQYAGAAAVGGSVWVVGGLGVKSSSTTTKAYDPVIDTWKTGPGLPLAVHHTAAVNYKGTPVVIGGWIPQGSNLTAVTSDRVFALRGGAWEELPRLNHPRAAAAAGVVGNKIVVMGGQANGKLVRHTEVFDGDKWEDVADIPTPREHLGGASDGRYVYAVGGRELASDQNVGALERYDPSSDSWTKLPDMPTASGSVSAAVVGGRLVTVGGESPTEVINAVQGYDIHRKKWQQLPRLRTPRHGVALAAIGDTLYAIGGATAPGHVGSTRRVEELDFSGGRAQKTSGSSRKWQQLSDAPFAREYAGSAPADGAVWVFGGLEDETASREARALDPVINTWKAGPDLPQPLHHMVAVNYKGSPVVIGGWVPQGSDPSAVTSDRVFTLRGDKWEELPRLNHPRAAAAAGVVGDKIVVMGGQADGKLVRQTEVFDGDRWKDVADIPTPREHLGGASDGRYVYAVGGRKLAADKNSGALERYDPASDRWTKLPSMPTASGSLSAAVLDGRLITVGGESPTEVINAVQAYDLKERTWSALPGLPKPRHGVALSPIDGALYAIGGATEPGHVGSTREVDKLDLQ